MQNLLEVLKNLTEEQAVKIATISHPDIKWKLIHSKNHWDGFDLIEEDGTEDDSTFNFQIDYRTEVKLNQSPRFRFYENLFEYKCNNYQDIINYLETL
ncbi:MAG TPA: hypothetical protein VFF27_07145 [Bacteroidia bacterium]|jgi:hypothetical protein|nr:hypothetical protein [Bacteroidia bacterium]